MSYSHTMPSAAVLGEKIRIGDIIQQERPNYESRKLVTLAANQSAAVVKGQVLCGNAALGEPVTQLPSVAVDDKQTLTFSEAVGVAATSGLLGSSGTITLIYSATGVTTSALTLARGTTTNEAGIIAAIQAAVRLLAPELAAATVADDGTKKIFTITTPKANVPAQGMGNITVSANALLDFDGLTPITCVAAHSQVGEAYAGGEASCVSLVDAPISTSTQQILVGYREIMLKPGYITYGPNVAVGSAAATAANQQLEAYQLMVVLTQPTFGTAQDVDLAESVTQPTSSIPGL